jgi:hypothetical protein
MYNMMGLIWYSRKSHFALRVYTNCFMPSVFKKDLDVTVSSRYY